MRRQALVVALLAAGCGNSDAVKELDVYTYRISVEEAVEAAYSIGSNFVLQIGDKNYPLKNGEVEIPKDLWLTKSTLAMVIDTTCGAQEIALTNIYDDEARMRQSAARYDQAIAWKLAAKEPLNLSNLGVVVDNHDNPKAVTVRIGTIAQKVDANTHTTIGGVLGACKTAREIAVDDKVVGAAKTDGTSTLVDVSGTHCYLWTRDWYGSPPLPSEYDKLVAYSPGLYTIGRIDNWFTPNPTTTTVRVANTESAKNTAGTALASLTHTTCPRRR
jgi:hypothetical protein